MMCARLLLINAVRGTGRPFWLYLVGKKVIGDHSFWIIFQHVYLQRISNGAHPTSVFRNLLSNSDGELKKEGDILKNPKLARTLQNIQVNGSKDFYEGHLARRIVNDVKTTGGTYGMVLNPIRIELPGALWY